MLDVRIRPEQPADHPAVHALNEAAFEQPAEAELVDTLRAACPRFVSLVAELDGTIAGHIFFSPCTVDKGPESLEGMGLAPMAVSPQYQRQGIGSRLVTAGLSRLKEDGCPYAIVLGHPNFYPRFGFTPASAFGLRCQWEAPGEAFMAIELEPGALAPFDGVTARYHPAFDSVA